MLRNFAVASLAVVGLLTAEALPAKAGASTIPKPRTITKSTVQMVSWMALLLTTRLRR